MISNRIFMLWARVGCYLTTDPEQEENLFDPLKILNLNNEAESPLNRVKDPVDLLWTDGLYVALTNFTTMMSVVVIVVLLITMLFVKKSEALAEKKKDILHKLLIVFIVSSLISIMNILFEFSKYMWVT